MKIYACALWLLPKKNGIQLNITWNCQKALLFQIISFIMSFHCEGATSVFFPFNSLLFYIVKCFRNISIQELPQRIMFQLPQLTYFNSMWKIYGILNLFINFRLHMTDALRSLHFFFSFVVQVIVSIRISVACLGTFLFFRCDEEKWKINACH